MLKYLKFQNFRSYYDETILSMEVKDEREKKNFFSLHPSLVSENLYNTMMFIGFNGAGKSNLLSVLSYISFLVTTQKPAKTERNFLTLNDEHFCFYEIAENEPRCFEIGIIENDVYFEYSFKMLKSEVLEETLKYREKNVNANRLQKIKTLFKREKNAIIEGADDFKALSQYVNIMSDSLFISTCASYTFKKESCPLGQKFIDWFNKFDKTRRLSLIELENDESENLNRLTNFIRKTDNAVRKIEVNRFKLDIPVEKEDDVNEIINYFKNNGIYPGSGEIIKNRDGLFITDLDFIYNCYESPQNLNISKQIKEKVFNGKFNISSGQKRLSEILSRVFNSLNSGSLLILDELNQNLHHSFPKFIIGLFNNKEINTKNAQLIFSSHDSSLLDNDLSKAQIKHIRKDKFGVSRIFDLQKDGKPIKSDLKISKHFLSDEFEPEINLDIEYYKNTKLSVK